MVYNYNQTQYVVTNMLIYLAVFMLIQESKLCKQNTHKQKEER